ncbi:MAG: helix-turn-helix domain-containing protein [Alphaproteobacteria bacterium]|nr:helix-turn-helix domain-containing protein [Alphaproteobacteria bacterium]
MTISTAQIRGARGLLDWSQAELSRRTGISTTSIGNIESGHTQARESTLQIIRKSFEVAGIDFIGKEGVRVKSGDVHVFEGYEGFKQFYDDIYNTLRNIDGHTEVMVSNVDERQFFKALGDYVHVHIERMKGLTNIGYKFLIREGDDFVPGDDFAQYRAISKDQFSSVPFYIYGQKLAIILFNPEPTVIALNYPAVAMAYSIQFNDIWDRARTVEHKAKDKANAG